MSDRHLIAIADFGVSDRYPIALRGSTQTDIGDNWLTWLCQSVFNQPPLDKRPRSRDQLGLAMGGGGGAKRMGGGKRTRERALPKMFGPLQKSFCSALSWIFVKEKQSTET